MASKIKKGDSVVVLAGKDKGKNGKVLKILRSKNRPQNIVDKNRPHRTSGKLFKMLWRVLTRSGAF